MPAGERPGGCRPQGGWREDGRPAEGFPARSGLAAAWQTLRGNPLNLLAFGLVGLLLLVAALAPALVLHDPLATNVPAALQPPSARFWFGTDQLGRDIFSRVLLATRLDLAIAFAAVALSGLAGAVIGAAIGFWGGSEGGPWGRLADGLVSRLVDVLMAFPLFVLALALVAALGNSVVNIVYATAIVNLPFYIRLARGEMRVRRTLGYVEAARVGGSGDWRILRRVLLPAMAAPLLVQASVNLGWAVLNAAGLSFLGLGVRPPTPEWGIMVAEGARHLAAGHWWVAAFPGLALVLAVFAFNLLGDALRDLLDPRMRG